MTAAPDVTSSDIALVPTRDTALKPLARVPAQADGMVTVEIGPDRKKYCLHKALVTHHSEYFRKALHGPWVEAQEGVVKLDDVGANEFNVFVYWLYNQPLPTADDYLIWCCVFNDDDADFSKHMQLWVLAYALGDRLLAPAFRKAINNIIVSSRPMSGVTIATLMPVYSYAFANIPDNRPLLQFLVDDFCENWIEEFDTDSDVLHDLPPAFLARVLRRYSQKAHATTLCCHLEHADGSEQQNCGLAHMVYDEKRECGGFLKDC
ncbi:hypothetical protein OPT61_g6273 [Boeremia exigua]|uniref:Uncharacterized protein n=1 Tax=Boeremia exigua TaxID=749465 RepID=A0ACC2I7A7_9PLEO|nr:hypothetical protein OPT61_g6273 [Boeremia exigua]